MSYVYSDAEMLLAAKLAYMDIPAGTNINEWLEAYESTHAADASGTSASSGMLDDIRQIREIVANNNIQGFENWRVIDVKDRNAQTGFYASLYDTGSGDALIGFRGSEAIDKDNNLITDWIGSDLGLLDSMITPQQADATDYMRYIYEKYGDKYDSYSTAGHSLGGNLAQHAMYTAPEGMRDQMDHAINFDGPGYSNEYILLHSRDIKECDGKVSHYEWSVVGSLLLQPEGTDDRVIKAQNDPNATGSLDGIDAGEAARHDIKNMYEYLEDGHVVDGERGNLQEMGHSMSVTVEKYGFEAFWLNFIFGRGYNYIEPETKAVLFVVATPIIHMFAPVLEGIHAVHMLVYDAHAVIKDIERAVENLKDVIGGFINDMKRKYLMPQVSGEFEFDPNAFTSVNSHYLHFSAKLEDIIDSVENLELGMAINAHSSRLVQAAIFGTKCALEIDDGNVKRINNKLSEIFSIYNDAETKVVVQFE